MKLYDLDITFKASPKSTFFTRELGLPSTLGRDIVAELGTRSIRVRKAKSPGEAQDMAHQLQTAFAAHALPDDVVRRLKEKLA
jgi:hypothetical protein